MATSTTASFPPINADRLWQRVQALSQFTDPKLPWTRRAFSERFMEARAWLKDQMEQAGLVVRLDEGGNLIGRRAGSDAGAAPLVTGSHCDTVMEGGRFDGIIGVLAGIEVAHTLHEQNIVLAHPLEVIDFLSEEPSDYGISCVGSRAYAGTLDAAMLAAQRAADGQTLAEGMRGIGARPDALDGPLRAPGSTAAFVELHIEQGPVLEARGLPIGVVTHIVGIRRALITVTGRPDHAGTTPMDLRRDALVGAARLIDGACRRARELDGNGRYVVATVGHIDVSPNAANAVPGRVDMVLEVRSDDEQVVECFAEELLAANSANLRDLRVEAIVQPLTLSGVTRCAPHVMQAIEDAAGSLGYRSMRLPSGAGHDGVHVAHTGPIGMIFIPCLDGRSHCPEEWIEPAQLLDGARVLYQALLNLDRLHAIDRNRRPGSPHQAFIIEEKVQASRK
ncbi:MAG TPA: Zn-dependent hydrolase [Bordetella sp.]|nr:Zn-dependent hydrolase [Bordetella sp.]